MSKNKIIEPGECVGKECFVNGEHWGHLGSHLCKYIGEINGPHGPVTVCGLTVEDDEEGFSYLPVLEI